MDDETKEWVSVKHGANGATSVTVTIVQGNLSIRWSVKTYPSHLKTGLEQAKREGREAMATLRSALAELEQVTA